MIRRYLDVPFSFSSKAPDHISRGHTVKVNQAPVHVGCQLRASSLQNRTTCSCNKDIIQLPTEHVLLPTTGTAETPSHVRLQPQGREDERDTQDTRSVQHTSNRDPNTASKWEGSLHPSRRGPPTATSPPSVTQNPERRVAP